MAQGLDPVDAACAGVYLHGLAGELLVKSTGWRAEFRVTFRSCWHVPSTPCVAHDKVGRSRAMPSIARNAHSLAASFMSDGRPVEVEVDLSAVAEMYAL